MNRKRNSGGSYATETTPSAVVEAMGNHDWTDLTTKEIAEACDCSPETANRRLKGLEESNRVKRRKVSGVTLWTLV